MRPQQERLEALTGLRFVAAAAVFAVHLKDWVRTPAWNPGTMANAAVGFFFVLSGFILAHVYRREGKPVAATAFYRARFARIWPAHLVCLALAVAVNPHPEGGSTGGLGWLALDHAMLLQAWTTETSWAVAMNGPAWSLSAEIFFYSLFPLFVSRSNRHLLLLYAISCGLTACLYVAADTAHGADPRLHSALNHIALMSPVARLQEFVLGICVHAAWRTKRHTRTRPLGAVASTTAEIFACAAVALSFRTWSHSDLGPAWIQLPNAPTTATALSFGPGLSWSFGLMIYIFASGQGWISKMLGSPPMRYLGEISYAFYLVHLAVLIFVSGALGSSDFDWRIPVFACSTVAIAASALLHATVELPAREAILARGIGIKERIALGCQATRKAVRRKPFVVAMLLGITGIAFGATGAPHPRRMAEELVRRSTPELRGVRFGDSCTLLGATISATTSNLRAWGALQHPAGTSYTFRMEARTMEGALVHALDCRERSDWTEEGSRFVVFEAEADFAAMLGAVALTLIVCDEAGAMLAPGSGPVTAGGAGLDLLRVPR